MRADKDLAKKVLTCMKDEVFHGKYSIETFCKEHNLFHEDDLIRQSDRVIHCFRHVDAVPSLSINNSKDVWRCFSCGAQGKYLDFVLSYQSAVLGSETTWYQMLNQILREDAQLMALTGIDSIFIQDKSIADFEELMKIQFKKKSYFPSSYTELMSNLKERHFGKEKIIYAILLMQADISPKEIYAELIACDINKKEYCLNSLYEEENVE